MNYFTPTPKTLEELKKQYRALAHKHHPDNGGDTEAMKAINGQYEKLFTKLKNIHQNKDGETYTKETDETASQFIELIAELMKMENIIIEVIGSFVWVSGETKPHKDKLKELLFKWHSTKKCWYLPPDGYIRRNRKDYTLDEIRDMYGTSGEIRSGGKDKITASA